MTKKAPSFIYFGVKKVPRSGTPFAGNRTLHIGGYGKSVKPRKVDTSALPAKIYGIADPGMELLSNEGIADEIMIPSIRQAEVTRLIHGCAEESKILDWVTKVDDGSCEDGFPMRPFVDTYFTSEADAKLAADRLNEKFSVMARRKAKNEKKPLNQVAAELHACLCR